METSKAISLAVLRNYTIEMLVDETAKAFARSGTSLNANLGHYDAFVQETLDDASHVYDESVTHVLVSLLPEYIDPSFHSVNWDPAATRDQVLLALQNLRDRSNKPVIVTSLLPPMYFEGAARVDTDEEHRVRRLDRVNSEIADFVKVNQDRFSYLNLERLIMQLGAPAALDDRFRLMYRSPYKLAFARLFSEELHRSMKLFDTPRKKCIVLDCDNTLWGGVVGEEGIDGIALDPNDFPGNCFHQFQQAILNLHDAGVIVALCSKNNEEDVFAVLDQHPSMLIKRDHVSAWRVNWSDKPSNIAELAQELNIGLDSLVFVDDRDYECEFVRTTHPDVTVLRVPDRLHELPRLLYDSGLFDSREVTAEDKLRASSYAANRERDRLMTESVDKSAYLRSLEIRARIHPVRESEIPRVAQLLGKTNQFNLTTRRHSETDVRAMVESPDWAIHVMHAADRFSELGLIGISIVHRDGDRAEMDSFLLSCRALGRELEYCFADHVMAELEAAWGVERWEGLYIPTKKNAMVSGFWGDVGMAQVAEDEGGVRFECTAAVRGRKNFDFIEIEAGE